jgi:hypothetical protein
VVVSAAPPPPAVDLRRGRVRLSASPSCVLTRAGPNAAALGMLAAALRDRCLYGVVRPAGSSACSVIGARLCIGFGDRIGAVGAAGASDGQQPLRRPSVSALVPIGRRSSSPAATIVLRCRERVRIALVIVAALGFGTLYPRWLLTEA